MSRLAVLFLCLCWCAPAVACPGDCDDNQLVEVHELVLAVRLLLAGDELAACPAADADGDRLLSVADLVAGVNAGLRGCAASSPTPSPTVNPTPRDCGDGTAQPVEECDDGNRRDGDGCAADCTLELGGDVCRGVPAHPGAALTTVLVTDAVEQPVAIAAPPLDPHRLFIVEQRGRIRLVKDGVLLDEPFLDLTTLVSCCGERGLLGLAFHPDYERNGRFFVNYTDRAGDTVVARYAVSSDPDRADPGSAQILLPVDQPFANHNGGQVAFGPDGALYVGMGDGGGGGDPLEVAQDDGSLLGKLLRLDVDVDEPPYRRVPADNPRAERGWPLGLIWAKGLRNPWRFSFDRLTGDLYIGDVGQFDFEEIDVQPAASPGGENYGWDIFEARACYEPAPAPVCPEQVPPAFTPPVLEYNHRQGCSVTGGFVYRGCALPDLRGEYFFSDFCSAFLRSFHLVDGVVTGLTDWTATLTPGGGRTIDQVASFGEDARGELYIADTGGEVYKIAPAD